MAKTNFSSAVETSLIGRTKQIEEEKSVQQEPFQNEITKKEKSRQDRPVKEKASIVSLDELFPGNKVEKMSNRSFYISDEIYEKLEAFAKSKGMSSSRVVNDLLKSCL